MILLLIHVFKRNLEFCDCFAGGINSDGRLTTYLYKPLWDNFNLLITTENHKYFNIYKTLVNKNLKSNNVEVIFLLGQKNEIKFENVKNYFTDLCFESTNLVEKRFSVHEIVNCKKK